MTPDIYIPACIAGTAAAVGLAFLVFLVFEIEKQFKERGKRKL